MNRTLKRPMFRIGGSAGTGITSGLDKPRTNYQFGGGADARRFVGNRMMTQPTNTTRLDTTPIPTSSTRERLLAAIGQQPNNRNLSQFFNNIWFRFIIKTTIRWITFYSCTSCKRTF